jgi:hypothetical protein
MRLFSNLLVLIWRSRCVTPCSTRLSSRVVIQPPFLRHCTAVPWKNLMRSVRHALFAFVLATLLGGPTRAQVRSREGARAETVRQRRLQYPDLVKVAELAQNAPYELTADALLRVAASERNHDRVWKIELLEESFQMATLAWQPNRQKIIGSRLVYRSRAGILSLAFDQRLDRLFLQSRAIRQMLKLDKAKALDMFYRTVLRIDPLHSVGRFWKVGRSLLRALQASNGFAGRLV